MTDARPLVLITGIANERSLAFAVAQTLTEQGFAVVCTWADQRLQGRVERLAQQSGMEVLGHLNVCDPASMASCVAALGGRPLAGMLHAIAFARLNDVQGQPLPVHQVDAQRWAEALEISARSLPQLLHCFRHALQPGSGVVALTHHGARRVAEGYNLMGVAKAALEAAIRYCAAELGPVGIRVNGLSAGSVRTAAASAVPGFAERYAAAAQRVPLRRNVTAPEVAAAAAWLIGPAASAITGAIIPVDNGEHVLS